MAQAQGHGHNATARLSHIACNSALPEDFSLFQCQDADLAECAHAAGPRGGCNKEIHMGRAGFAGCRPAASRPVDPLREIRRGCVPAAPYNVPSRRRAKTAIRWHSPRQWSTVRHPAPCASRRSMQSCRSSAAAPVMRSSPATMTRGAPNGCWPAATPIWSHSAGLSSPIPIYRGAWPRICRSRSRVPESRTLELPSAELRPRGVVLPPDRLRRHLLFRRLNRLERPNSARFQGAFSVPSLTRHARRQQTRI